MALTNLLQRFGEKISLYQKRKTGWDDLAYKEYRARLDQELKWYGKGRAVRAAHRQGFLYGSLKKYGIENRADKSDYLSERDFFYGFPYNGLQTRLFDDKLSFYYSLQPFKELLPEYYYLIGKGGQLSVLPDAPGIKNIITCLEVKKNLALKPFAGTEGRGFIHLQRRETTEGGQPAFFLNEKRISRSKLEERLETLNHYLVMEYLKPTASFAAYYPDTVNSIRVIAINGVLSHGLVRFGSKASGAVDNTSQGGVFCMLDVASGSFSGGIQEKAGKRTYLSRHPDTNVELSGRVPEWEESKLKLKAVLDYLPRCLYLGLDLAYTTSGLKIIEINSLPEFSDYQTGNPLTLDPAYHLLVQAIAKKKQQYKQN